MAALSVAVEGVLMMITHDPAFRRRARLYACTTCCALPSYFGLIQGALLAIAAQRP
ncbi:MAG: hypothetical protein OXT09_06050 [Myxococcales bacterium]|nr:hypothetical protein [Myxococcales bacterium]